MLLREMSFKIKFLANIYTSNAYKNAHFLLTSMKK